MQGTNRITSRWPVAMVGLAALFAGEAATAGIVMNATRYIYDAGANEIAVKVSNTGKIPVLTQAWIDDGDARSTPERVDVPFNLTPPISRIESGKSQTLRVSYTDEPLPADRESLFWINILEVPPKPAKDGKPVVDSTMQLAFRYRLKLFYRPKGLSGSAVTAPGKLAWTRGNDGQLAVNNPTAFHVTLNDVRLDMSGSEVSVEPFAIAPFATTTLKVAKPLTPGGAIKVRYQSINDYGGFVTHDTVVGAP